ncbi:hypothetical protein LIER_37581 [Lithospermum erythrorhizon]|uniref:Uncharacterized protein n=1 Tax=Lithospermum erythrorhizon TaxID=34254 RepID=A0AAV3PQ58_LITER
MFVNPAISTNNKKPAFKKWDDKKGFIKCNHCGMKDHLKDACYRLHRFPERFGKRHKKGGFRIKEIIILHKQIWLKILLKLMEVSRFIAMIK